MKDALSAYAIYHLHAYAVKSFVALHKWEQQSWVKELLRNKLVEIDDDRNISVTKTGRAFVKLTVKGMTHEPW